MKPLSLQGFHQIYLEHRDFIRSVIYWMVRSQAVDDLVQESFLRAWRDCKNFREEASIKTWLYRIARNTSYDYLRKQSRQLGYEKEVRKDQNRDIKTKASRDQLVIKDLITKGLMDLSVDHREVFILFYKMEYTQQEIASLTGVALGTVKSRIHHAKKQFYEFIEKNGELS